MNINIIYEDNDIIVCNKPANVPTQTKNLRLEDMETKLKKYQAAKGEEPFIGIVHRLDQPVKGVMVFGKNKKATAILSKQVSERTIGKYYKAVAICKDKPLLEGTKGILENYMDFDRKNNMAHICAKDDKGAKKAILEYEVLSCNGKRILFDIKLKTGRHHQIRLQMSEFGYPLLGDRKYGKSTENMPVALCSYKINFSHPVTGKEMEFSMESGFEEYLHD
ncbi:MAG: RluA family pseudouridine synthase [Agathobacter sp.]|nr:RluA family pseudouridine synthase [Agathobacter sp.]